MLTRKMNVIKELMTVPSNVKQVMENVARYDDLLGEFKASHEEYQHVLSERNANLMMHCGMNLKERLMNRSC